MKKGTSFIIFFIFSIAASFLNYLTYPILSRLLQSAEFINTTVALSLLSQMSMFLSSIVALTIGLTKEGSESSAKKTIEQLQQELMLIFLALILLFLGSSVFIFKPISLEASFAIPISIMLLLSIPISIYSGYMNGKGKLVKLAAIALITSSLQLLLAVIAASVSGNGLVSLLGMTMGQVVALCLILFLFKSDNLPRVSIQIKNRSLARTVEMQALIKYTLFASIGVLLINILQISDLLIFKARPNDVIMYTDIYIISRVVFFAGIIFIWPLLAKVDIEDRHKNIKPLAQFAVLVSLMGAAAITFMAIEGELITKTLFGTAYPQVTLTQVSSYAIIFKCLFLILTALTLYCIVIRSYLAFWVPLIIAAGITTLACMTSVATPQLNILIILNLTAFSGVVFFLIGLGIEERKRSTQLTQES